MPGILRRPPVAVTPDLVEGVERMSRYGVLQGEIARRLGCSASTVARIQARRGLRRHTRQSGRAHSLALGASL